MASGIVWEHRAVVRLDHLTHKSTPSGCRIGMKVAHCEIAIGALKPQLDGWLLLGLQFLYGVGSLTLIHHQLADAILCGLKLTREPILLALVGRLFRVDLSFDVGEPGNVGLGYSNVGLEGCEAALKGKFFA